MKNFIAFIKKYWKWILGILGIGTAILVLNNDNGDKPELKPEIDVDKREKEIDNKTEKEKKDVDKETEAKIEEIKNKTDEETNSTLTDDAKADIKKIKNDAVDSIVDGVMKDLT